MVKNYNLKFHSVSKIIVNKRKGGIKEAPQPYFHIGKTFHNHVQLWWWDNITKHGINKINLTKLLIWRFFFLKAMR
jgi:hypothetical protein